MEYTNAGIVRLTIDPTTIVIWIIQDVMDPEALEEYFAVSSDGALESSEVIFPISEALEEDSAQKSSCPQEPSEDVDGFSEALEEYFHTPVDSLH